MTEHLHHLCFPTEDAQRPDRNPEPYYSAFPVMMNLDLRAKSLPFYAFVTLLRKVVKVTKPSEDTH